MSEELRTIRLYGKLGAKFGRVHRLAVSSCAEAMQALAVLLPAHKKNKHNNDDDTTSNHVNTLNLYANTFKIPVFINALYFANSPCLVFFFLASTLLDSIYYSSFSSSFL